MMAFIVMAMMTGATTTVMAQTGTSATVTGTTAGVRLIVPMVISQTSALNFGTINVLAGAGGTCILPSNSTTRSFTGGLKASSIGTQPTNAAYNVSGTKGSTYVLSLPPTITVTETTGTTTMSITNLLVRFSGAGSDATVSTLSPTTGNDSFTLGGTLTVPAGQVGGLYTGKFDVSVDYN